jgi:asparagine synthase (glutamine-hydrolysing)
MSVQAGIWNFDGKTVNPKLLDDFSQALKQQGPDGEFCHADGSIALFYRPFHTTAESRREKQPYVSRRGFVITWDGRLDNREELATELCNEVTADPTDVALFGAVFDRWESECFRRIIGDWAASIWNPQKRELIFACDFMAIKHIFYYLKPDSIWWATDLTPLVLLSGDKFHVDDEYIAGYFANDPEGHVTPYREIRQVPPGHFIRIRNGAAWASRFWRFSPKSRVRYNSDAEYEEHFRHIFRSAVARRLRSDSPVLAELSGGLDSSSIVCMADSISADNTAAATRVDTISYIDMNEPHADDWIYVRLCEEKRKRPGIHLHSIKKNGRASFRPKSFCVFPGSLGISETFAQERSAAIASTAFRVVLSGIGGDEFMGGVPNPTALLADLIVQFRLPTLTKQLTAWSLAKRKPWIYLLLQASTEFLPATLAKHLLTTGKVAPWLNKTFSRRQKIAFRQLDVKDHFGLLLPTRRSYIGGVFLLANQLAKKHFDHTLAEERRYPYLDRDLIEFILSIPASQLLRPGERRSLMRRALAGIVPEEIFSRRTKQLWSHEPVVTLGTNIEELESYFENPISELCGYIDGGKFLNELRATANGKDTHLARLLKTISLEIWLRTLASRGLLVSEPDSPLRIANIGRFDSEQQNSATLLAR